MDIPADIPPGWAMLLGALIGGLGAVAVQVVAVLLQHSAQRKASREDRREQVYRNLAGLRYRLDVVSWQFREAFHMGQLFGQTGFEKKSEDKYREKTSFMEQLKQVKEELARTLADVELLFSLGAATREKIAGIKNRKSLMAVDPPQKGSYGDLRAWHHKQMDAERIHLENTALTPLDEVIRELAEHLTKKQPG